MKLKIIRRETKKMVMMNKLLMILFQHLFHGYMVVLINCCVGHVAGFKCSTKITMKRH